MWNIVSRLYLLNLFIMFSEGGLINSVRGNFVKVILIFLHYKISVSPKDLGFQEFKLSKYWNFECKSSSIS